MTGRTPVPRVARKSWIAPAIDPWSVRPTADISSSAARATRSGIRHAPSRIEYSLWTCRWTNGAAPWEPARFEAALAEPVSASVTAASGEGRPSVATVLAPGLAADRADAELAFTVL